MSDDRVCQRCGLAGRGAVDPYGEHMTPADCIAALGDALRVVRALAVATARKTLRAEMAKGWTPEHLDALHTAVVDALRAVEGARDPLGFNSERMAAGEASAEAGRTRPLDEVMGALQTAVEGARGEGDTDKGRGRDVPVEVGGERAGSASPSAVTPVPCSDPTTSPAPTVDEEFGPVDLTDVPMDRVPAPTVLALEPCGPSCNWLPPVPGGAPVWTCEHHGTERPHDERCPDEKLCPFGLPVGHTVADHPAPPGVADYDAMLKATAPTVLPLEATYPCDECERMRTKAEGGTVFTVCDECWTRSHPRPVLPLEPSEEALNAAFRLVEKHGIRMGPWFTELVVRAAYAEDARPSGEADATMRLVEQYGRACRSGDLDEAALLRERIAASLARLAARLPSEEVARRLEVRRDQLEGRLNERLDGSADDLHDGPTVQEVADFLNARLEGQR